MQNYINLLFTLSFLCAEVQCYCFILSHIKKLQVWCGNTYSLNSFPDKALLFLLSYSSVNNWRKDKKGAIFLRKRDACETMFLLKHWKRLWKDLRIPVQSVKKNFRHVLHAMSIACQSLSVG